MKQILLVEDNETIVMGLKYSLEQENFKVISAKSVEESKEKIKIVDLIQEQKKADLQEEINQKIQLKLKKEATLAEQGYNVYRRDVESDIYKIENANEFYIKDKILYIIYCYGNNSFTSEVDLIVTKI